VSRLRAVESAELVRALEKAGFERTRQRGSHVRMRHPDGRVVTVPLHLGHVIGRGLLRKILRDSELSFDDVTKLL